MTKQDPLDAAPFDYRETKDGRVRIAHHGKVVATLAGPAARKFLSRVAVADFRDAQRLMARVTGQYKFGNERG